MRFRKKPVVIDAVQWTGDKQSWDAILAMGEIAWQPGEMGSDTFHIATLEGDHLVRKGDWIIKGVKGEFYPCKPDIFDATYEQAVEKEVIEHGVELAHQALREELEALERVKVKLREHLDEKARRVYYQDIVYYVCNVLDKIDGKHVGHGLVCGTLKTPITEVQDRMDRLEQELRRVTRMCENLLRVHENRTSEEAAAIVRQFKGT